ncbi:c-type cytochrome [Nitrospina gracilis]|uniref:c-type cytochrome n=1 Tax=Nitrospina gracilis TaxID=35801 RepID=UPI001F01005D|nr:c-type cytochrome [Nitrospina gracilis]MCF8721680.1 mono/diheme cytochrome c family protein [Nitrospina gracilis Nb-211]
MLSHRSHLKRTDGPRAKIVLTLLALGLVLAAAPALAAKDCPQPRKTKTAPAKFLKLDIPKNASAQNGETLFQKSAKPMACKMCHGDKGDGKGPLGKALKPAPRNFTCAETMSDISPGQMFWIIKNGSSGTGMVAHGKQMSDKEIWDLVKYIQTSLAK